MVFPNELNKLVEPCHVQLLKHIHNSSSDRSLFNQMLLTPVFCEKALTVAYLPSDDHDCMFSFNQMTINCLLPK